jgi:hypothetical protein
MAILKQIREAGNLDESISNIADAQLATSAIVGPSNSQTTAPEAIRDIILPRCMEIPWTTQWSDFISRGPLHRQLPSR